MKIVVLHPKKFHMKKFLFFLLIGPLVAIAQPTDKATIKARGQMLRDVTKDVSTLASDQMEGRETGTKGEQMAADYIVLRFGQVGLAPKGEEGTWFQEFEAEEKPNPHGKGDGHGHGKGDGHDHNHDHANHAAKGKMVKGKNVIGYLDHGAKTTIVIGAHYDHLGFGAEGSLHAGEKAIHNGADDNASGVAAMIQLAKKLRHTNKSNNYLFIAFSGEEKGLWGSNWFCKHPTIDLSTVNYMINMDMVGRLSDEKELAINGTGTSPTWTGLLSALPKNGLKLVTSEGGVGPSDHTSFYLQDIPVLHFFTGQHADYHKPTDDINKVNFHGIVAVTEYINSIITSLDDDEKLKFTKTKDEDSKKAPEFSVTLGVMPDYMYSGDGMRIDGIIDDRPAQKAGILKGDIVTQMGDVAVKDMRSYMEGLSQFQKGDKATVTIKRGDEVKKVAVQF